MPNLIFYIANWGDENIDCNETYPLFIEHVVREKGKELLICVEKITYGSFINREIKIWFPKSAFEGIEDIHTNSNISEIHVKGWFLIRLVRGQYEYEL